MINYFYILSIFFQMEINNGDVIKEIEKENHQYL